MSLFGRSVRIASAAALFGLLASLPATSWAQPAQTLSSGQQVQLDQPGTSLTPLRDGRLSTYGVASDVAGVAFTGHAGSGSEAVVASPGTQLVVVELRMSFLGDDDTDPNQTVAGNVSVAVTSGSLSVPLSVDTSKAMDLDEYFAAAIPSGKPAVLSVSDLGLTQSIDLRTGKRTPPAPSVLYRAHSDPVPSVSMSATQTFNSPTSDGHTATGTFGLQSVSLSYWQPQTTTFAPSPDQAYLCLYFRPTDITVSGQPDGVAMSPVPGSEVMVKLPDGQTLPTTHTDEGLLNDDLLSGVYWLQVPADITSASVTLHNLAINTQYTYAGGLGNGTPVQFNVPTLTTQVNLPPPWQPNSAPTGTAAQSPTKNRVSRHGGGTPWWAILLGVLAAAAAAGLGYRLRRNAWLPASPMSWPPAHLPPATARLLTYSLLALPPGTSTPETDGTEPITTVPPTPETPQPSPAIFIRLLGPLEVDGLVEPISGKPQRRLLVCLAVTPERPLGADDVARAISDHPERDPKTKSVNSYASKLRRSLPPGLLPDARVGGYTLDHSRIAVDLNAILAVAKDDSSSTGWADRAEAALSLVRGRPLLGGSWEGIQPVVRMIQKTIEDVAHTLAAQLLQAGDPAGSEAALCMGLKGLPESLILWEDRLEAAAAGSGYGLEQAWSDTKDTLEKDAALLFDTYQRLRRQLGAEPADA